MTKFPNTEREKSILGSLFGAYSNLALDLNTTIDTHNRYPKTFRNFDDRMKKIMKHIRNLESLASCLGYTISFVDHYRFYDKITGVILSYDGDTLIKLNLNTGELAIDPRLI